MLYFFDHFLLPEFQQYFLDYLLDGSGLASIISKQ